MTYMIDYAQEVDPALDERLNDLNDIQSQLESLISTIKHADSNAIRRDYERLMWDADKYLDEINDDIESTVRDIDEQLSKVGVCYDL